MAYPGVGLSSGLSLLAIQLPLLCIAATALFMLSTWHRFFALIISIVLGCAGGVGWFFLWLGPLLSPISFDMLLGTVWVGYLPVLTALIVTRQR